MVSFSTALQKPFSMRPNCRSCCSQIAIALDNYPPYPTRLFRDIWCYGQRFQTLFSTGFYNVISLFFFYIKNGWRWRVISCISHSLNIWLPRRLYPQPSSIVPANPVLPLQDFNFPLYDNIQALISLWIQDHKCIWLKDNSVWMSPEHLIFSTLKTELESLGYCLDI